MGHRGPAPAQIREITLSVDIINESGEPRAAAAAQVRDHLVMVRGGAPFLSGADARLLGDWLDEELPVAGILACIDAVAQRRRGKPARSRLSLSACKGEVKKLRTRLASLKAGSDPAPSGAAPAAAAPLGVGWAQWLAEVEGLDLPTPAGPALCRALREEARRDRPPLEAAAVALSLVRSTLAEIWEVSDQTALQDQAAAELAPILAVVPPRKRAELLEQGARDQLLRRWPSLAAPHVCRVLGALP